MKILMRIVTFTKRNKWIIPIVALGIVMVVCLVILISQKVQRNINQNKYMEMQAEVNTDDNKNDYEQSATNASEANNTEEIDYEAEKDDSNRFEEEIEKKHIDWDKLKEENEDIYAWITVTGVDVDYPVVQHMSDDSYYLSHNLDGSVGYPGCIMTEHYNKQDFTDKVTVLYGHNLRSGEMFTSLHNFEDVEVFEADNYIYIITPSKALVYEIFSAREYSAEHLLANYDYSDRETYETFIDRLSNSGCRVGNIKKDVEVTSDDRIIVLSTCTPDSRDDLRFIVTGVLIYEEDML